jgi:hypothetical protein
MSEGVLPGPQCVLSGCQRLGPRSRSSTLVLSAIKRGRSSSPPHAIGFHEATSSKNTRREALLRSLAERTHLSQTRADLVFKETKTERPELSPSRSRLWRLWKRTDWHKNPPDSSSAQPTRVIST